MCRFRFLLLVASVAFLSIGCSLYCPWQKQRTLTILHTNDTHAHISPDKDGVGGYATIAGYVQQVKSKQNDVLVLDAGDVLTGTVVSSVFEGTPIFEIMNTIPYDAGVLGNHEFDFGWKAIEGFAKVSDRPLLNANVKGPGSQQLGDGAVVYRVVNGIRVGIIGVVTSDLPGPPSSQLANSGPLYKPASEVVGELLPEVQANSDLVLVLSHCGIEVDRQIARENPEVDVIIGGHTHSAISEPERVGRTVITMATENTKKVGRLDIVFDLASREITQFNGQLVLMDSSKIPAAEQTQVLVDHWQRKVAEVAGVPIAVNDRMRTSAELAQIVGAILKDFAGADYGLQLGRMKELPQGAITERQIWEMLPYLNQVMVLELNREQLRTALTDAKTKELLQALPDSGDSDATFTLAIGDYHGKKLAEKLELPQGLIQYPGGIIPRVVLDYVRRTGSFESPAP